MQDLLHLGGCLLLSPIVVLQLQTEKSVTCRGRRLTEECALLHPTVLSLSFTAQCPKKTFVLGVFAPWQDSYSLDHPPFHAVVCLFVWPPISGLVGLYRRVLSVSRKRESDSIVALEVSKFE